MKKRILYLDILRVIACFAVIMIHVTVSNWNTTSVYEFEWKVFNFYYLSFRFCVPVFVMISGVFFLEPDKNIDLKKILNNILRIVQVFIFWSLIYETYSVVVKRGTINLIFFINIIYGHYHMWFLFMIVGLYIITPFLREIAKDKRLIEYFIILSFIFGYLVNFLMFIPKMNTIIEVIINKMNLFFVLGYTGYFFTGYYLNKYELDLRIKKLIYILAIISLLATILISSFLSIKSGKPNSSLCGYLLPNTFVISCAIFIFFKEKISKKKFGKYSLRIIEKLSLLSLGIYMIHVLYLEIFSYIGISTLGLNHIISVPLIAILNFLCSYITVNIMSRIPFFRKYI